MAPHATCVYTSRVRGLEASAGVWLRTIETEISAARGPLWLGKDFSFFSLDLHSDAFVLLRHFDLL